MGLYEDITESRRILGIYEHETLKNIKDKFKSLIKQHHPDVSKEDRIESKKITEDIIWAYKTITNYCNNYKFSFEKDEVNKYLPAEEFWRLRFGNDPLWSNNYDHKKG